MTIVPYCSLSMPLFFIVLVQWLCSSSFVVTAQSTEQKNPSNIHLQLTPPGENLHNQAYTGKIDNQI